MALFVVVNFAQEDAERYAGKAGSLAGLEKRGVLLDPFASDVVDWLVQHDQETSIFIAHHPKTPGQSCIGDSRLSEVESNWRTDLIAELNQLLSGSNGMRYRHVHKKFSDDVVAIKAKCLRHRLPSPGVAANDASQVFAGLAELASANLKKDEAAVTGAIEALVREFEADSDAKRAQRSDILTRWYQSVAELCVLELELSALADLQGQPDKERPVKYLTELLEDHSYKGFTPLLHQAESGIAYLKKERLVHKDADLAAVQTVLADLAAVSERRKKAAVTAADADKIAGQFEAYTRAVWQLSDLFRKAVAQTVAAPADAAGGQR